MITITYKDSGGLQRTLDSLKPLLGTNISWEHVVIDSSPEENCNTLSTLPSDWPLKHVSLSPKGIYNAMNEGVKQAQGKYLWFLNGGDCLHDVEALKNILRELDTKPTVDIISAAVNRVREGRYQFHWDPGVSFFRSTLGGCGVSHQGIIYRKEAFTRVGPYDERYKMSADYEHHLRCLIARLEVQTSRETLADFDVSGIGATGYHREFAELREIHSHLSNQFPIHWRLLHSTFRKIHIARVWSLKKLQASPISELLRAVWLTWKQRHDSAEPRS